MEYLSPLGKSDHSVLAFNFKCYVDSQISRKRFIYEKADYASMKQHARSLDWKKHNDEKTVESLWQQFKSTLLQLRNQFVPLKETGKPFWKKKGKIPISQDLQNLIHEKKRLHRKFLRSTPSNLQENRVNYIQMRNNVNRRMKQERRNYERDICKKSKENPKIFWSHVRSKLTSVCGVSPLLESVDDKCSLRYDDRDKANILQKQFSSVFTHEPEGIIPRFEQRTANQIEKFEVTSDMVRKQIMELEPNKLH